MNYGLYLSATGMRASSYRQDVIANNLANVESIGFKRSHASFHHRLNEALERGQVLSQDPMFSPMTGGFLASPTQIDLTQGEPEPTGNPMDLTIVGKGFFAVSEGGKTRLTRNGQFILDRQGYLTLGTEGGPRALDERQQPIRIEGYRQSQLQVGDDGSIRAENQTIARIGMFNVDDPSQLVKSGGTLLQSPDLEKQMKPNLGGVVKSGFLERSNVDPAMELTQLMDAHRQLEANANMIRYQDQALGKLVNEVGKIS